MTASPRQATPWAHRGDRSGPASARALAATNAAYRNAREAAYSGTSPPPSVVGSGCRYSSHGTAAT